MPTMSELREQYPNSFGWRIWQEAESGLLRPPCRGIEHAATSSTYRALCRHGNHAPAVECPCGVHYVTRTENFCPTIEWLNSSAKSWGVPMSNQALTFGVGFGQILPDLNGDESWLENPRRCAEYRILGILLPAPARPMWQQLAEPQSDAARNRLGQRYGVPVMAGRVEIDAYGYLIASARRLERLLDERATDVQVDRLTGVGPPSSVHSFAAELCEG
ncbi:hypothetical protein [Nocardia sp. MW-W600-9]